MKDKLLVLGKSELTQRDFTIPVARAATKKLGVIGIRLGNICKR